VLSVCGEDAGPIVVGRGLGMLVDDSLPREEEKIA
jgi:hypothetical protein